MRTLMVSHRFPPDAVAGVERYTESLAGRLVAMGDRVTVLSRRPGPGPVHPVREDHQSGNDVIRLVGGGVDRARWLHLAGPLDELFSTILEEVRPDVVHANHLVDLSPRFLTHAREAGAAVVFTAHDFWAPCPRITLRRPDGSLCAGPEGGAACVATCLPDGEDREDAGQRLRLRALYFRRLLEIPDRLLCPSPYVSERFERWGLEAGRMEAVANGIDVPREGPPPRAARAGDRLNLAILGAVVRHKGHHVVLDALERSGIAADLYVHGPLGDPGYVGELRAAADALPEVTLRVCGTYEPADLSLLLAEVDVLLAPSVWPETFCLVVREALVRGVPVITTRLGALPDAIEPGVNGFTYGHDDPDELAHLLTRIAARPRLRETLREGAAATPVTSVEQHADRVRAIYAEAIDTRESRDTLASAAATELAAIESLLGEETADRSMNRSLEEVA